MSKLTTNNLNNPVQLLFAYHCFDCVKSEANSCKNVHTKLLQPHALHENQTKHWRAQPTISNEKIGCTKQKRNWPEKTSENNKNDKQYEKKIIGHGEQQPTVKHLHVSEWNCKTPVSGYHNVNSQEPPSAQQGHWKQPNSSLDILNGNHLRDVGSGWKDKNKKNTRWSVRALVVGVRSNRRHFKHPEENSTKIWRKTRENPAPTIKTQEN